MKMLIAGLAAASALLAAGPGAQAKDHGEGHGHGYGHEKHYDGDEGRYEGRGGDYGGYAPQRHYGGYAPRHYGYYRPQPPYGHAYGYYGQRRHSYGLRCFYRYGREICVRR